MKHDMIERLAEKVHRSWMEGKARQGFHYPGICPYIDRGYTLNCSHCHPEIVDYSLLSEQSKDLDRAAVNAILDSVEITIKE